MNVIIFGVDNSSSSHADNCKKNFLVSGEADTFDLNRNFRAPEKKFSINFSKAGTKLCLILHYNGDNSYLFVNEKEVFKFEANNESVNFPTPLCLGSISDGFGAIESRQLSLGGNVYNFSVECNAIDKSDILNIHNYLMGKNNIK